MAARHSGLVDPICRLLDNLGTIAARQGDNAQAEHYWLEMLTLARASALNEVLCTALSNLEELMTFQKRFAEAECYHEEGMILVRKLGHPERMARYLLAGATRLRAQEDYVRTRAYIQEGRELCEQIGNRRLLCQSWLETADLALQNGELDLAEQALQRTEEFLSAGQNVLQGSVLYSQARLAALRGNISEARRLGESCLVSLIASNHFRLAEVQSWLESL